MPTAFQPMDNSNSPHWQYPEMTDAIPAEMCGQVFRVIKVETEEINRYVNPSHPDMRAMGRSKRAKLIKQWELEGWSTRYVPYAGGFWERQRETIVRDWEAAQ